MQAISVQWMDRVRTPGLWIGLPGQNKATSQCLCFARSLTPPGGAVSATIYISADNKYQLWRQTGNDLVRLGRGPARAHPHHQNVHEYHIEIAPMTALELWAQVYWVAGLPHQAVCEMHTPTAGLWVNIVFFDAQGNEIERSGTDSNWLVYDASTALQPRLIDQKQVVAAIINATEQQDLTAYPSGWLREQPTGQTPCWVGAQVIEAAYPKGDHKIPGWHQGQWWLVPNELPPMEAQLAPFPTCAKYPLGACVTGVTLPLIVPAQSTCTIIFDAGRQQIAYPRITLDGPARVQVAYAERLLSPTGEKVHTLAPHAELNHGLTDEFITGAGTQTISPFHWRSFRFMVVTITAGSHPVVWQQVNFEATGYPFTHQFQITSAALAPTQQEFLTRLQEVSWHTIKCCTWETFMDCPYYEQLQYIGDTRIQALVTYTNTQQYELAKQALLAFDHSRIPEGITQSRFPSNLRQLIPTFSLIYIMMLRDYQLWTRDQATIDALRPGVAPILNWFMNFFEPDTGLIANPPYWNFVDWVEGWSYGVPPGYVSTVINLQYVQALQAAADLYEQCKAGSGQLYHARANQLRQRIFDCCYDAEYGLLCDVPIHGHGAVSAAGRTWSQHAQALGVLTGTLQGDLAKHAMITTMEQSAVGITLSPASFYWRFYMAEALAHCQLGEYFWGLLEPYRAALVRGSTTWPECFEPTRSECHAWGSWPLYFLAHHVLGIQPPDEFHNQSEIKPSHCTPLDQVSGQVATPYGPIAITVDWTQTPVHKTQHTV
ncbi:MAG: hypothetical protein WCJ97_00105 [Phycisphaerae bacterium]